jgi:hypothetical protein
MGRTAPNNQKKHPKASHPACTVGLSTFRISTECSIVYFTIGAASKVSCVTLDALNIECDKCGRRDRYRLDRLIARYGIDAKLFDWSDEITADCPRKQVKNLNDSRFCGNRSSV